jgi:HK97 family phage prohead protease
VKPNFLNFGFEVKEVSNTGIIEGYASVFGNIDRGDDIVDKGAFKKTIKESKGKWPILFQHDPAKKIGYNIEATEDDHGLLVKEQLNLESQLGKEEYSFAKMALDLKTPFGLSIGYSPIKAEPDKERPVVRRLKELRMWEHSHVTFPMNQAAMITAAKSWLEKKDLGLSEYTDLFFKHMEEIGFKHTEVMNALHTIGAAGKSDDSDIVVQSIDRAIAKLKS